MSPDFCLIFLRRGGSKMVRALLFATVAAAMLAAGGCATNPVTGKSDVVTMSAAQEVELGRKATVIGILTGSGDLAGLANEVVAAARTTPGAGDRRPDGHAAYLQRIVGLPLGPSREQGVVQGSRFYHGTLGMTVAFPTGWTVDNQPTRVVASTPQKDAFLQLTAVPPPPGAKPQELLARSLAGVPLSGGGPLAVNGLEGHTAVARDIGLPWGNRGPARGAVIYYNGLAYVFTGASRLSGAFAANDALFMSSIKTFRRLRDNELKLAEPQRIKLVKATAGTRIAALAASSPIEKHPAERLRLLNDLHPDREPVPGEWLKIVE